MLFPEALSTIKGFFFIPDGSAQTDTTIDTQADMFNKNPNTNLCTYCAGNNHTSQALKRGESVIKFTHYALALVTLDFL